MKKNIDVGTHEGVSAGLERNAGRAIDYTPSRPLLTVTSPLSCSSWGRTYSTPRSKLRVQRECAATEINTSMHKPYSSSSPTRPSSTWTGTHSPMSFSSWVCPKGYAVTATATATATATPNLQAPTATAPPQLPTATAAAAAPPFGFIVSQPNALCLVCACEQSTRFRCASRTRARSPSCASASKTRIPTAVLGSFLYK